MHRIKIATRKSRLALVQSEMIKSALIKAVECDVELLPLSTTGDKDKTRSLLAIGGKGLFTKEIEEALLRGEAQIAMHSLKDMPVDMPEGLLLAGVLPRDDARDVLISHKPVSSLDGLAQGARIGTSSPRRAAQILAVRPDIKIIPFRGNVPTRLQKVQAGEVDATILAAAGLERLQLKAENSIPLNILPAIGQGLVAIQCRADDDITLGMIKQINHQPSWHQARAERALLKVIGGDCHTPLAANSTISGDTLTITAQILNEGGQTHYEASESGNVSDAEMLGQACGKELLPKAEKLWQRCS